MGAFEIKDLPRIQHTMQDGKNTAEVVANHAPSEPQQGTFDVRLELAAGFVGEIVWYVGSCRMPWPAQVIAIPANSGQATDCKVRLFTTREEITASRLKL